MKAKKPDVCLVVPPNRSFTQRMPLSLMYISSYLTANKEDNNILDIKGMDADQARECIQKEIKDNHPSFIGMTCLVGEAKEVKELCRFIKDFDSTITIIIGGPYPTVCPNHFLDMQIPFDYLVIGEGEHTFLDLIRCIRKKRDIKSVNGVAYVKTGKLVHNKPRQLIKDLDSLPLPAYDKVDMEYYCRPNVWAIRPVYLSGFYFYTSRGCPYSCNYCVAHTIFGRKVRFNSAERVVEHIEHVVKSYQVDALFFGDESFTVSKDRVRKIFKLLKKKGIKIIFGCQTRVNLLDEPLLTFMKHNGCIQIDLGVESGSERMLKIMNKGTDVATITKVGEICRKISLRCLANMLINVPGEKIKDIEMSLDLVKEMRYSVVLWNVYTPFPGVCFGAELDMDDLNVVLDYPSEESLELLETKYKFGKYNRELKSITDYLYSRTFHPKHIKFTLRPSYWASFFRTVSFIIQPRYLGAVATSKRRMQYLTNLFTQKTKI